MRRPNGVEAKARLIQLRVRYLRCFRHDEGQPGWNLCAACKEVMVTTAAELWKLSIREIKARAS